jgi:hypothetical protein
MDRWDTATAALGMTSEGDEYMDAYEYIDRITTLEAKLYNAVEGFTEYELERLIRAATDLVLTLECARDDGRYQQDMSSPGDGEGIR